MRTKSSVSLLFAIQMLCLAGCRKIPGTQPSPLIDIKSISCHAVAEITTCLVPDAGNASRSVTLDIDSTVKPNSTPSIKITGQLPNDLVLVDSYPSQPGGLGLCQAGTESFLRVISITTSAAAQTFHTKLESCRDNVELALNGVALHSDSRALEIHWLSAPETGEERFLKLRIDPDGKVVNETK